MKIWGALAPLLPLAYTLGMSEAEELLQAAML